MRHLNLASRYLSQLLRNSIKMEIVPIKALEDNYMYFVIDSKSKECAVIDPVEPQKIMNHAQNEKLKITKILTTHHHWDHANGNPDLVKLLDGSVLVYGGDDRIPAMTNKIKHNDTFKIGSLNVTCLFTPCHTSGHICYYVESPYDGDLPAVFTGDTLFIGGCGKFFEGTPEQMHESLINVLSRLPDNTLVYCGHEYTLNNLRFAETIEPFNENLKQKYRFSLDLVEQCKPTVPSTIQNEKLYNPFMRVNEKSIHEHCKTNDPIKCMETLRKEKDSWKPLKYKV